MAKSTSSTSEVIRQVTAESPVAWFFEFCDGMRQGDLDRAGRAQRKLCDLGFDVKVHGAKLRKRVRHA